MNIAECPETAAPAQESQVALHFPFGLFGFEEVKQFALISHPAEQPFEWLQVQDNPNLAFLVLPAGSVVPDYQPQIATEDLRSLNLESAEDALILNIATLHGSDQCTLNLKGPILINPRSRMGKQVIPLNAPSLSVRHPLRPHAA